MSRLMGFHLGISFQTELLIMTLLGLANSTLDWKPFELFPRLNFIKELSFSDDSIEFSNTFSERIRSLLTVTVIVEFFCGLLNPLTYLLKLYPIITWSRSNLLLPWLLTHALNTILPKMLSVSLVFVFYRANKISTLSLLEFVVVESINLSIASYNWYVFFAFYLNLREVEYNRVVRIISDEKMMEGPNTLSQTYSSIPDLPGILFREPLIEPVRSTRSLTYMLDNDSQELDDESSPSTSFEENLSPAEISMKILHLTRDDLEDAKKEKFTTSYDLVADNNPNKKSDSSVETYKAACSCSSSDEDIAFFLSKKLQTKKEPPDTGGIIANESLMSIDIHSRPRANNNPINSTNQSTQVTANLKRNSLDTIFNCPFTSHVLNRSRSNSHALNDNLYFLLSKNIELMDKMCRTISSKNKTVPKDNMDKWLIFQHELECNLQRHVLSKESTSKKNFPITSESSDTAKHDLQNKIHDGAWKFKQEFDRIKSKSHEDSKLSTFSAFNRMLSRNNRIYQADGSSPRKLMQTPSRLRKMNTIVMRSNKMENTKELWNLKVYNDLTLEQDRREMMEKKKQSRLVDYENVNEEKKQVEKLRCNVLDEECKNLKDINDYLEMRKRRSKSKLLKKQRPKRFSAKNLPKKLNYQRKRTNIKELIKKINWNLNLNTLRHRLTPIKIKTSQNVGKVIEEDTERTDVFEDETLSELQNAFSHSDDNERGFQLGPETNQPYPIFQMVALTLTEIFKSQGWRSPTDIFRHEIETESDFLMSDDVIFCGNEYATETTRPDETDRPLGCNDNKWDEIERRKAESVSLVRQLEELLDTSRETLSAIETSRDEDKPMFVNPQDVLQHYFERLQSDDIGKTIANWATESIESMDSIDFTSNLKYVNTTVSFSDNSDMEEFPTM